MLLFDYKCGGHQFFFNVNFDEIVISMENAADTGGQSGTLWYLTIIFSNKIQKW